MTREERTVFLAILTLFVYAGVLFLEHGVVLFPFPLNEFIFLFVAIPFSFWYVKKYPVQIGLVLLSGILNLLSTQFFWSFFLNSFEMEKLVNGISMDLLKIAYTLSLTFFAGVYFIGSNYKWKYLYFFFSVIGFFTSIIFFSSMLQLSVLTIIALIGTLKRINSPLHLLWILLASLELMKILTLYL